MSQPPPSVVVYTQPGGFDEGDLRWRCRCCCCKCCHIKWCALFWLAIQALQSIYNLGKFGKALATLEDPGRIAFAVFVNVIVPALLIVAIVICVIGIFLVKPLLTWPVIIVLVVRIICDLVMFVCILLVLLGVDKSFMIGILNEGKAQTADEKKITEGGTNQLLKDTEKQINEILHFTSDTANIMISIFLMIVAITSVLLFVICLFVYLHLKKYLTEKQAARENMGGAEMSKIA